MKKSAIIYTCYAILIIVASCKKSESPQIYSSINVVNAAVGAGTVKVNYFGRDISWQAYIGTNGVVNYGTNQILTVFNLNNDYPFTIVPSLDTLNSIIKTKISMEPNGMYSLYATGTAENYEYVFNKENDIPYNLADSVVSIRFINLSPNSPPINITLASTPAINEATGLVYKGQTAFKRYSLNKVIPTGTTTFELRDPINNQVLSSYTIPPTPPAGTPYPKISTSLSRFKSITLAVKGLYGTAVGANAYTLFPIANY